jgi:hypothetical protein
VILPAKSQFVTPQSSKAHGETSRNAAKCVAITASYGLMRGKQGRNNKKLAAPAFDEPVQQSNKCLYL